MNRDTLDAIRRARAEKRAVVVLTNLNNNIQNIIENIDINEKQSDIDGAILDTLRADRSAVIETDDGPIFAHVFNPPLRLLIVGAVHIAQALAPMAAMAGYGVTVIDPRRAFATDARFPDIAVRTDWPDEALTELGPDARTAVVALTHDPKLDDPALASALRSDCFYIGALGSKRTHAKRCERLRAAGLNDDGLGRIHGPIGLAIGARSPAEIAIAILAEMTANLRQAKSR